MDRKGQPDQGHAAPIPLHAGSAHLFLLNSTIPKEAVLQRHARLGD
jgi:hypothetical protein